MTEDWIHYFDKAKFDIIPSFEGEEEDRLSSQVILFHKADRVDWENINIAVIGVPDARNSTFKGAAKSPDAVRKYLYGLRTVSKELRVVDMGNLRGNTVDDRYSALTYITGELIKLGVIPLVLGGSQDYTIPMAGAMKKNVEQYRLSVIDSKIDWQSPERDFSSGSFLGYLCDDNDRAPRDLSLVGIQKYLFSRYQEDKIKNASYDFLRLGEIRQQGLKSTEPWMRDADVLSVDMTAVRQCDQPAGKMPLPNGLTGEELCQLLWYAGLSDKLKAVGIFELDIDLDINEQGIILQAQAIWHILEGVALRYNDYPVKNLDDYRQFIVQLEDYDLAIKFYNNPDNDRWWVEIPGDGDPEIVACEKRDFEAASEREIPERWFRFIKKRDL